VIDGADHKVHVNWDLAGECDQETVSLCPTRALHLFGQEMTVDEVLDEVEQDKYVLSGIRRRYYAQRWRVPAATRLQRRTCGWSAPAWDQYGDRDRGQRAMAFYGVGLAVRRRDAPRPQAHRSRSP
jgi:hypothetical protein